MADDHDALLTRADEHNWSRTCHSCENGRHCITADLAAALRESQANYHAALDIIARLTEGWDIDQTSTGSVWVREPILADERDDIGPDVMSDREWRVFCHAAQRATGADT